MASLFNSAIVALCLNAQGVYNDVCVKAVDAGTRQAGWRQEVDNAEDKTIQIATHKAEKNIGKPVGIIVGSSAFIYRSIKNKSVELKLPKVGFCDSITGKIAPNSYDINFKWEFK
jgi:hypothetical protein